MKFRFYAFILAIICVIVFSLQIFVSSFTDIFVLNSLAFSQIWRFFSAIFLHGSSAHLISNLFALILFGSILEKLVGGKNFLIVFFLTGILANLVSVNFYNSALGASGAIFGVIGALIIIRPTLTVFAFGLPMPIFIAGIIWAFIDVLGVFAPSGVANIAHLSGMFFGLVFGLFFRNWEDRSDRREGIYLNERNMRDWEDRYMR